MTTTPNFCALCAALDLEAMKLYDKGYSPKPPPEPGKVTAWMYQGEDDFDGIRWRENWKVTIDEKLARFKSGNKEPIPLFQAHDLAPPPEPPTDEEIKRLAEMLEFFDEVVLIRAALERWGQR
jgi:hypothetical protein